MKLPQQLLWVDLIDNHIYFGIVNTPSSLPSLTIIFMIATIMMKIKLISIAHNIFNINCNLLLFLKIRLVIIIMMNIHL